MMRGALISLMLAGSLAAEPAQVAMLETPARAGRFLLSGTGLVAAAFCRDGKLRVWALPEGRLTRTIDTGGRRLDSIAISVDGGWIAAGDHDGAYTVWKVSTGAPHMQFRMPFYPFDLSFSPDGARLAVAPAGEPVEIYDMASKKKLFELLRTVGGSQAVVFSRDGRQIATADSDTVVRIYDARNGELRARHTDFLLEPLTVSFTADGRRLLAAGGDKVIATLDASNGNAIRKSDKLADPVAFLEVSPDGAFAAVALMHADNLLMPAPVLILETESGGKVQEWLPGSRILGGGWTSDGRLLMATGTEKGIQLWRVR
jgi:WD40 repeat protein